MLAFSVVLPLTAGHALRDRRWLAWLGVAAAVVHMVAWYANARRYAVGIYGPVWFPGQSR